MVMYWYSRLMKPQIMTDKYENFLFTRATTKKLLKDRESGLIKSGVF